MTQNNKRWWEYDFSDKFDYGFEDYDREYGKYGSIQNFEDKVKDFIAHVEFQTLNRVRVTLLAKFDENYWAGYDYHSETIRADLLLSLQGLLDKKE